MSLDFIFTRIGVQLTTTSIRSVSEQSPIDHKITFNDFMSYPIYDAKDIPNVGIFKL